MVLNKKIIVDGSLADKLTNQLTARDVGKRFSGASIL